MNIDFMQQAINVANMAGGEIPVGAVIVKDGKVIASAFNKKEAELDVTSHAEILAIREASKKLKNWRLEGCSMYVTLEPCPMCAWAILQARLNCVYFGAYDLNYGALSSKLDLCAVANSKLKIYGGIMEEECNQVLQEYFKALR